MTVRINGWVVGGLIFFCALIALTLATSEEPAGASTCDPSDAKCADTPTPEPGSNSGRNQCIIDPLLCFPPTPTPTPELVDDICIIHPPRCWTPTPTPTPEPATPTPTPEPATPTPTPEPGRSGRVAPSSLTINVGETTEVYAYDVHPPGLKIQFWISGPIHAEGHCDPRTHGPVVESSFTAEGCSPGTATVTLRAKTDGFVLDTTTITVVDPRPAASFSSGEYSVTEGRSRRITVSLDPAGSGSLTIPVTVMSGTAESGDYSGGSNRSVTFKSGDTSETLTIITREDSDCDDETVNLGFGTLPSGVSEGSPSTATLTILDNDTCEVSFGSSSYSVTEGSSVDITVSLTHTTSLSPEIPITVTRGTAESGDYTVSGLTNGNLTFSSGQSSRSFTINTIRDSDCDDETVNLAFGTLPSGVSLGSPSTATLTIKDPDCPTPTPTPTPRPTSAYAQTNLRQ